MSRWGSCDLPSWWVILFRTLSRAARFHHRVHLLPWCGYCRTKLLLNVPQQFKKKAKNGPTSARNMHLCCSGLNCLHIYMFWILHFYRFIDYVRLLQCELLKKWPPPPTEPENWLALQPQDCWHSKFLTSCERYFIKILWLQSGLLRSHLSSRTTPSLKS